MSNRSSGAQPSQQKDTVAEQDRQPNGSPSKTEYQRKLSQGTEKKHEQSRSRLSGNQASPAINSEGDGTEHRGTNPNMLSLTTNNAFVRKSSQMKQSVLVKRVYRDGRVVSGLENFGRRSELMQEEDQGTLGS